MVTLLIPTINRSDFLIKYLTYLKNNQFEGQVLIGDSSNEEHYEKTENFIKNFNCKYEIRQYLHPNLYPHQCIQKMLNDVSCPYCMFICDDDILIVDTLKKCINFLKDNSDYSGVGGVAIGANLPFDDYDNIVNTWHYRVRAMSGETAVDRVNDLMSNYRVIAYSLARTEQFKKRWPKDSRNYDKAIGTELLPCAVLVAQGKVKMLDDLFVVRQMHERRILLPTLFDTILDPQWATSTSFAISYLAKIVADIDSIDFDEALQQVKYAWCNYIARGFIHKYGSLLASKETSVKKKMDSKNSIKESNKLSINHAIREFIKKIPGAREVVNQLRNVKASIVPRQVDKMTKEDRWAIRAEKGELSLPALLHSSSPYHKDFMPVYEAITGQPVKL
tara:strand:- start:9 stop:1178 length:1170 start_codon:yes stop_codon:yes gene_type:complete